MIQIRYEIFNSAAFLSERHARLIGPVAVRLVVMEKGATHPMEVMPEVGGATRASAVRKARRMFGIDNAQFYRGAETIFCDGRLRQVHRGAQ